MNSIDNKDFEVDSGLNEADRIPEIDEIKTAAGINNADDAAKVYNINEDPESVNVGENISNTVDANSSDSHLFYKESYKKTKNKKSFGFIHLIVIALISSILGGSVVGGIILAGSSLKAGDDRSVNGLAQETVSGTAKDAYTKVVIDSSGSPVSAIAEKVNKSIVGIKVTIKSNDFFMGTDGSGEGTGIIIKSDGYIMTNNHVVESAIDQSLGRSSSSAKIEIVLPGQLDKPYPATIVGRDKKTDLAVLKIDAKGLPAAELGDSDKLKIGELAVAIGNPGGLDYMGSVTVGVISGLNRTVSPEEADLKLIQTDAAINPGNSGGPLINSNGQVIGINSAKIVAQGFEGLGFAIPINTAKTIVDQLLKTGYVKGNPALGVICSSSFEYNEDIARQYNLPVGVLIDSVTPLSGAYKAGLKRGDIITKFVGVAVKDYDSLNNEKNKHKPGETVSVEIYRDGKTLKVEVTLTEQKY
jgi:serine protease Do